MEEKTITDANNTLNTIPKSLAPCKILKNVGWLIRYIASPIAIGANINAEIDIARSVFFNFNIWSMKESTSVRILFPNLVTSQYFTSKKPPEDMGPIEPLKYIPYLTMHLALN